jgi:hypothetical protein
MFRIVLHRRAARYFERLDAKAANPAEGEVGSRGP